MFSTPWHISRYTIRMSSSFRLKVLNGLISRTFIEKLSRDSNQKIFSRNPLHNLLELLTILLSIFDLGRRDKLRIISSLSLYYMFLIPISRIFFISLNKFEKNLISILVRYDLGYVDFSNSYFTDYLNELFLERIQKSSNPSNSDWKYIARITFQLDKEGILAVKALKSVYGTNSESIGAAEIWKATTVCAGVFHLNGFFKSGEKIEKEGKKLADKVNSRSPGHYLENAYFSAVGHISLLDYFLKGRKLEKFDMCKEQLVYDKTSVSNQELARLFLPICKELKIDILENLPSEILEGDLETYIRPGGEYATARRMYSDIQMQWESEKREPLIHLTDEINTLGCNILEKNGLPKDAWFVGLHIRSAKDLLRLGRNADFENYVDAVAEISEHGGWTLRTGTEQSKKLFSLPNFIDTRELNLSKFEREVLHTYIWARSRFFIGNLSGGTNPPGAFGVPILWTDIHPISGFRPPSRRDLLIPKMIHNVRMNRKLSLEECLSEEHRYSQSENPLKLLMNGYELLASSSSDLRSAVRDMLIKISLRQESSKQSFNENKNSRAKIVDTLFSKLDLAYGAELCGSFLDRNPSYLE